MERTIQRPTPEEVIAPIEIVSDVLRPVVVSKLDLTGIKGFTQKKKGLKIAKMKQDAITELQNALGIFDPHEINLNHTAVLFCAQIVEDYFTSPQQGVLKEQVVVEVCKKFFNGDEALVKMVLELVFEKVIKTTLYRRNKERIKNGLGWFLTIFGMKVDASLSTSLKL